MVTPSLILQQKRLHPFHILDESFRWGDITMTLQFRIALRIAVK
jgi:hypothetical protein